MQTTEWKVFTTYITYQRFGSRICEEFQQINKKISKKSGQKAWEVLHRIRISKSMKGEPLVVRKIKIKTKIKHTTSQSASN